MNIPSHLTIAKNTKLNIKHLIVCSMLALLSACGSHEDSNSAAAAAKSVVAPEAINTEKSTDAARPVSLLISLAQLYPGGQLPAERLAQAAQDLTQNPAALKLTAEPATEATSQTIQPQALAADYAPVQRVQNTTLYGAYFFSIYPSEITTALAGNPNWALEGPAFWASLATGADLYPVHRFRNKINGSYLYSIYETERADIATNYAATFEYEGVAWYARQTAAAGWSTLWRFRNKTNGTYLFSAYESEKNAIVANYPDVFQLEGPAYYVRQDAQPNPVVTLSGTTRVIVNTLYTYSATVANATASAWSWLWGDGSANSTSNPASKVWYAAGSYTSTLTATTPDTPATATQAITAVAPIDAGDDHNCALQADATVRCWGNNSNGQLGDGTTVNKSSPTAVPGLTGVVALASGFLHSCALQADGAVRCWGSNNNGQLGDGTTVNKLIPTAVPSILTLVDIVTGVRVAAISASVNHTCALKSNGVVRCWGYNAYGQLGDGTTISKSTPTAVPGLTEVAALTTGWKHSCALKTDGTMRCWGANSSGQLGDNTTVDKLTPTPVVVPALFIGTTPLTGVATLTSGDSHTCALKTDGTVRCWGYNGSGQLGDGTTVSKSIPTTVPGLVGVSAISGGVDHSCAMQTDSTVRCWGYNGGGQLGDGTTVNKSSPVAVPSILSLANIITGVRVAALATGYNHSCALKTDGAVRCWGANSYGQIGDGTTTQRLAPTAVTGGAVYWK
jgi:alpha-tubulin suppressor-like RCC1 family protein